MLFGNFSDYKNEKEFMREAKSLNTSILRIFAAEKSVISFSSLIKKPGVVARSTELPLQFPRFIIYLITFSVWNLSVQTEHLLRLYDVATCEL